jgi:hypothetical protein
MAFSKGGLTLGRGVYNSSATFTGMAQHFYRSDDSLAEISANGYFPDNFSATAGDIKVDDILILQGNGNDRAYKVTSLSPATIVETVISDNPFNQSLNTADNVTFASTTLTPTPSNPGGVNTLWVNSIDGAIYKGAVNLEFSGVQGPVSSVDNTIPRFDGTTGDIIQGSNVSIDDANNVFLPVAARIESDFGRFDVIRERYNGTGIKVKGQGNDVLMKIGDVIAIPQTQNCLMNFQAKQNIIFFLEGDTDGAGSGDTPVIKMTNIANTYMFNQCIDTSGNVVIDLGNSTGEAITDVIINTGGVYGTAPATGIPPDYTGPGKTPPSNSLRIRGSDQVLQTYGGIELPTTDGTPAILSDYEIDTFTASWTGAFTNPVLGNFYFTRFGNIVVLTVSLENAPQNTADGVTIPANSLPLRIRPELQVNNTEVNLGDNGTPYVGYTSIYPDGSMRIIRPGNVPFSGVGNLAWGTFVCIYPVLTTPP